MRVEERKGGEDVGEGEGGGKGKGKVKQTKRWGAVSRWFPFRRLLLFSFGSCSVEMIHPPLISSLPNYAS